MAFFAFTESTGQPRGFWLTILGSISDPRISSSEWSECENLNHVKCREPESSFREFTKSRDVSCFNIKKNLKVEEQQCALLQPPDKSEVKFKSPKKYTVHHQVFCTFTISKIAQKSSDDKKLVTKKSEN